MTHEQVRCERNKAWPRELSEFGLEAWTVKDAPDGYCWHDTRQIDCIPGDWALLLHEIAHAQVGPQPEFNDKHNGIWGSRFTHLVRGWIAAEAAGGDE